jgi:hypothetical protein
MGGLWTLYVLFDFHSGPRRAQITGRPFRTHGGVDGTTNRKLVLASIGEMEADSQYCLLFFFLWWSSRRHLNFRF